MEKKAQLETLIIQEPQRCTYHFQFMATDNKKRCRKDSAETSDSKRLNTQVSPTLAGNFPCSEVSEISAKQLAFTIMASKEFEEATDSQVKRVDNFPIEKKSPTLQDVIDSLKHLHAKFDS